jgi:dTDP-4-dehydrorhamnose reductase
MRILILGGGGMLGHKAFQVLGERFDAYATFREDADECAERPPFNGAARSRLLGGVDALDLDCVTHVLAEVKPDAVINCVGIVKQRDDAKRAVPSILVNALLPHQLADACAAGGIRLIHLSTDCVFSGTRGGYTEADYPDPVDLYGRTKLLGEIERPGCLTLRTSIIGWELSNRAGLLEWFASQRGRTVKGFRRAIYTGLSTAVLAHLLGDILLNRDDLTGLYHVVSSPINKHDLLLSLRNALGWQDISIEPDEEFRCDRSLAGARFEAVTGWQAPAWEEMVAGLAAERPAYERWRSLN